MVLALLFSLVSPGFAAGNVDRLAKLAAIKGDVKIKKSGGAKPFKAINNMAVAKGDTLFTGKDSSAQLILDGGTKIAIGSNAQAMVSDLVTKANGGKSTGIKVINGQVWSKVQNLTNTNDTFKYETPTAIMGIRGTMLHITASSNQSDLWVTEGAVGVRSSYQMLPKEALVIANQRIQTTLSEVSGGTINVKDLIDRFDPSLLPEAANDIIDAVYEVAQGTSNNGLGKGTSNEFLLQADKFVHYAHQKDPSIVVPEDFNRVVQKAIEIISVNVANNPNPLGVIDPASNVKHVESTTPDIVTGGTGGGSSGGSGGGGSSGGGSSGGGGTPDPDATVTEISAQPSSVTLVKGQSQAVRMMAKYSDGKSMDVTSRAKWTSANEQIADVDQSGHVTGIQTGETTVTAKYQTKSFTLPVQVLDPLKEINLTPQNPAIEVGKTSQLQVIAVMNDGTKQEITSKPELVWKVGNSQLITIQSNGQVEAKQVGSTSVTVQYEGKTASTTVKVIDRVKSIQVSPKNSLIKVGETVSYQVVAVLVDDTTMELTNGLEWSTGNSSVATISQSGTATGVGEGTSSIEVHYQTFTDTASVAVQKPATPPPPPNQPPTAADVQIGVATGSASQVGALLNGSYQYHDQEGDSQGSSIIHWYRADTSDGANKVLIPSATSSSYTVTTNDIGKYLFFAVLPMASAGQAEGVEVVSPPIGPIVGGADATPPSIIAQGVTDTLAVGDQFLVQFSEELSASSKTAVETGMKAEVTGISDSELLLTWGGPTLTVKNNGGTDAVFTHNVVVEVTDPTGNSASLTLLDLSPRVSNVKLYDDDGEYGDGSILIIEFTRSLIEATTDLVYDLSDQLGISSSNITFSNGSTIMHIKLDSSTSIELNETFTLNKDFVFDPYGNRPVVDPVIQVPTSVSSSGIVFHPFVDTNTSGSYLVGPLTFSRATIETSLAFYKVRVYDGSTQLNSFYVNPDGSSSYTVELNEVTAEGVHDYWVSVTPVTVFESSGNPVSMYIGPEVTGVEEGATYAYSSNTKANVTTASGVCTATLNSGSGEVAYTLGSVISTPGSYTLTVKDEGGNTTVVHFTIAGFAGNIAGLGIVPGPAHYSVQILNPSTSGEELHVSFEQQSMPIWYGDPLTVTPLTKEGDNIYRLTSSDLYRYIWVYLTDSDTGIHKFSQYQLTKNNMELPPSLPITHALMGSSIYDYSFTTGENPSDAEIYLGFPNNSDTTFLTNLLPGDKVVAKFKDLADNSVQEVLYTVNDHDSSVATVHLSLTSFLNSHVNVNRTYSVSIYVEDSYGSTSEYPFGSHLTVDTRTSS